MTLAFSNKGPTTQPKYNFGTQPSYDMYKGAGSSYKNPLASALNSLSGKSAVATPQQQPQAPTLTAPSNQSVKSHSTTNPDGTVITQTYHPTTEQPKTTQGASTTEQTKTYAETDPTRVINPKTGQMANGMIAPNYTNTIQDAPVNNPQDTSYSGLIGNLVTASQGNQDIGNKAAEIGKRYGQQIADVGQRGARAQAGYLTTGTTPVAEGNAAVIAQSTAAQQQALSAGQQAELAGTGQQLTGQQQQQTGLGTAAGLASPIQVPYSNQVVNPQTGEVTTGTTGSLQDAVNNVVDKLTTGQMTYSDAVNALSGYGQGGLNALQQSLPEGFNIAQSNEMAGQQGSVSIKYDIANNALNGVEAIMDNLGASQTTNIPIINKTANWVSTQFGIGSEQTRAMTGAVQTLRNAYSDLLAASKGGTPADFNAQAMAEIPDEPTPNDMIAIRHNFETLGQARKDILSNPGQSVGTSKGGSTTAGGYNFKQDAQGNWIPA